MRNTSRVLPVAWPIFSAVLGAILPATASAGTTLQTVRGSGEFQTLETSITVTKPEGLTMQWATDLPGAIGGTWRVTNVTAGNTLVASGETPAPAAGKAIWFAIAANAFLFPAPPASPVKFQITITPHGPANQPRSRPSAPVVVTQGPDTPGTQTVFGPGAVFPTVELVTFQEKIGMVEFTQLHYAGADVTIVVKNSGTSKTDPMWLVIMDHNQLMRQTTSLSVPTLMTPGDSQTFTVHMDAILPPPKSQLPEDLQYSEWSQHYRERCGTDLYVALDWRGPQAQTPIVAHSQAELAPNTPVCDKGQCVSSCQVAKNIHKELDGYVVGYSYFVGLYPKFDASGFGANGYARTSADGPQIDFTPRTKITVASVSKIVTAIAAIRILKANKVDLGAKIGPFLPSDWAVSAHVKDVTFAELLGQHSGIKDYGNVTNDYATLKAFYSQPFNESATISCDPRDDKGNFISLPPGLGFTSNKKDRCYSNFNFAIMRILLPKVAKFPEDNNQITRPFTLASQYVQLVQQQVFDLVGQKNVACKPPSNLFNYSLAYAIPGGGKGYDWGDVSLVCGAAGWYLSAEDIARVLLSISAKDGKIFTKPMFDDFRTRGLGLDAFSDTELEKNGAWGHNGTIISTSVAIFGPVSGPRMVGVLFLNSNIVGGPSNLGDARSVLEKAYNNALTAK